MHHATFFKLISLNYWKITQHPYNPNQFIHLGKLAMKLEVQRPQRYAKMRAHTGVHILNALVSQIFPDARQEGSYVDEDYGRLDFTAPRNLTPQELKEIETKANQIIYQARPVLKKQMSLQQAQQLWAKAFFQEKYWQTVRVVIIPEQDGQDQIFSAELCGWTHVDNTREIWAFKIISYESIASGIKRIAIHTWPKVAKVAQELENQLDQIAQALQVNSHSHILPKIQKLLQQIEEAEQKLQSLATLALDQIFAELKPIKVQQLEGAVLVPDFLLEHLKFKQIVNLAKNKLDGKPVLVVGKDWQFAILGNQQIDAKALATQLGLKGGGNPNLFQGKDPKIMELLS